MSDEPPPATAATVPTTGQLVRRLLGLAWSYRLHCIGIILIQLVLLTMGIFGLSFIGVGIDYIRHVLTPSVEAPVMPLGYALPLHWEPMQVLLLLAGTILALAMIRAVLNYVYAISINVLVHKKLVLDMRGKVYDKLQRLSFRFYDANTTGSIIQRVTSDVGAVRSFVDQVLIQTVIMVISLSVYLVYMVSLSPGLTIACLATTPLLWIISTVFSRIIQPEYAKNRILADQMVQTLAENVQGIAVTKGSGREEEAQARFDVANNAVLDQQHSIFHKVSLFNPTVSFLTRVNMVVLLSYGGVLVIRGELALGAGLVVFAGLLEQFSGQVNNVANLANTVQQSLIGARRVFEILDAPIEVKSDPEAVRHPKLKGHVRFDNVSFAYTGIEQVLKEVNFEVKPGECVAILGATGAGKSVLMSLIPRFYDATEGSLLIDSIDVRRIHLDDLRRNIGLVFQENFLFSNSVAANIAFGHPEATLEQVTKAAKIASAHDFIMDLPKDYDTILGESGNTLSGGQRQRLAIARAVLLEPSILLLDDPTAAIDSETEEDIFSALDGAMEGRSTFIVAHRLSTLRRADYVIVMDGGRIVQKGTHDELMSQHGPYKRVANLQLVDGRELSQSPFPQTEKEDA